MQSSRPPRRTRRSRRPRKQAAARVAVGAPPHSVEVIKPEAQAALGERARQTRRVARGPRSKASPRRTRHDHHGDRPGDRQRGTKRERRSDSGAHERSAAAVDAAILSIEKQFGRGSIMKLGSSERQAGRCHPHRLHRARPGDRRRRHPARPDHGDLRPGVVGQDDALPARPRRGPEARRRRRLHRRRARARPGVCPRLRRER